MISHARHQWPVGQGFFHTGVVEKGGQRLNYVYDCGSEDRDSLRKCILEFTQSLHDSHIELLFISHLDSDHVNGLELLLPLVKTKHAILPYLSPLLRLAIIGQQAEENRLESTYVEFLCDPSQWLSDRGASSVIYLTPPPPNSSVPEWNSLPPRLNPPIAEDQPLKSLGLNVESLSQDKSVSLPNSPRASIIRAVNCITPFRLVEIPGFEPVNWQFVTYVHPTGDRELAFRREIDKRFTPPLIDPQRFAINQKKLLKVLANPSQRSLLAGCYRSISSNRNLTTLSLYSGPIDSSVVGEIEYRSTHCNWATLDPQVAWLGTGDDDLRDAKRRLRWRTHFRTLESMVATMSLPHHGSRHNFHRELIEIPDLFCVAAGKFNRWQHPHTDVVHQIDPDRLWVTNEDASTMFSEFIEMRPQ